MKGLEFVVAGARFHSSRADRAGDWTVHQVCPWYGMGRTRTSSRENQCTSAALHIGSIA
jgi:hypothetical protein